MKSTASKTVSVADEEEEEQVECPDCGEVVDYEDTLMVQLSKKESRVVCRDCYGDLVQTCALCGNADVEPVNFTDFILVKAEMSMTGDRLPGIYHVTQYPFYIGSMLGGGFIKIAGWKPRPSGRLLFVGTGRRA